MEFNDLKLGTIIKQNDSYSVVLGISDFPDYENRFAVKDAYNYIPIVVYFSKSAIITTCANFAN